MKISQPMLDDYQRHGLVKVEQLISREEAARYREATLAILDSSPQRSRANYGTTFHQYVDVWRVDETLRELTLHPKVATIAEQLAGIPLRLWHDQPWPRSLPRPNPRPTIRIR